MTHKANNFEDAERRTGRFSLAQWKRGISKLLVLCWIVGLSSTLASLVMFSTDGSYWYENACVNGEFRLFPSLYTGWSAGGFFQITLQVSGALTYTEAKVIDLVWDVFVGRCGQAVLAFFSWRAFASYVTTSMEVTPITFSTFRVIFLDGSPNFYSTIRLMRDFITRKGLYSRLASCFMVLSIIFTLLFPTLASAMTGYTTGVTPSIRNRQNATIPFTQFGLWIYTIHDGERINKTNDFKVLFQDETLGPLVDANGTPYGYGDTLDSWRNHESDLLDCSEYIATAIKVPGRNQSSKYRDIMLDPPILNISVNYEYKKEGRWQDQALFWVHADTGDTFDKRYIETEKHGICQPTQDYGWGFSFLQLYVVMILIFFWSIGTLALHMHAQQIMHRRGRTAIDGEYKAVISLAVAMEKELNIDLYSQTPEKSLSRSVQDAHGGSISYQSPLLFEPPSNIMGWSRQEKWWILALLLLTAFAASMPTVIYDSGVSGTALLVIYYSWWVSFGLIIGIISALLTCTTTTSRLVMTLALTGVHLLASFAFFVGY
ncbi:unnamed protein product [Periconia digitata]|uniref:Uncharacterized protein n=1 Tax=Periconia digitata TaxID=1303443 RepID=A0A9W4U4R9_9PLEO|nr:unnamed protein product [Periconia digitata]